MRRLVVALIVATSVLTLAGCGGGASTSGSTPTPAATSVPVATPVAAPASVPAVAAAPALIDRSAPESATFAPFPTGSTLPKSISKRLASKQPMVLYFYDSGQQVSKDQSAQIRTALAGNRGLADLVSFDVGQYADTSPEGVITVKRGLAKNEAARQAAVLSQNLSVRYTPYIIIVDKQGYITYKSRGYTDGAVIEREVLRASR